MPTYASTETAKNSETVWGTEDESEPALANEGSDSAESEYADGQVLVMYEKNAVSVRKGTKADLKAARKNPNVSERFGESMKAVKGAKNISATVDDQIEILDSSISGKTKKAASASA